MVFCSKSIGWWSSRQSMVGYLPTSSLFTPCTWSIFHCFHQSLTAEFTCSENTPYLWSPVYDSPRAMSLRVSIPKYIFYYFLNIALLHFPSDPLICWLFCVREQIRVFLGILGGILYVDRPAITANVLTLFLVLYHFISS